jgi:hypothetical protein
VEKAVVCFYRLIESFGASPEKLITIAKNGMVSNMMKLLSGLSVQSLNSNNRSQSSSVSSPNSSTNTMSTSTYTLCLRSLHLLILVCPSWSCSTLLTNNLFPSFVSKLLSKTHAADGILCVFVLSFFCLFFVSFVFIMFLFLFFVLN